jgi:hypothetical protein
VTRRLRLPPAPNRRGAVLLLFGIEFIIIGLSMTLQPASTEAVRAYAVADHLYGIPAWGIGWVTCGAIGCMTAWWPTRRDDLGFLLMAAYALLWGGMAVGSWYSYGAERGWVAGLLWCVHALLLFIVSGMDRRE